MNLGSIIFVLVVIVISLSCGLAIAICEKKKYVRNEEEKRKSMCIKCKNCIRCDGIRTYCKAYFQGTYESQVFLDAPILCRLFEEDTDGQD